MTTGTKRSQDSPLQDSTGWVQTGGPSGGFINDLAQDPETPDHLYTAGSPLGLYVSQNRGKSWTLMPFPERQPVEEIEIDSFSPSTLYCSFRNFSRSDDGGRTWKEINRGFCDWGYLRTFVLHPEEPGVVFAAIRRFGERGTRLLRSSDRGGSWRDISGPLSEREDGDIAVLTLSKGRLFAGIKGYGIFQWRESEWQALLPFGQWGVFWPMWDDRRLYQYTSLLIDPENSRRIMMGTLPQGIYLSEDGGASWRESNIGWTTDGVFRLVHHPNRSSLVFAGTYNGINRSYDFGKHWQTSDIGWPDEQWVFSIDFDSRDPSIMYACSKNGENEGRGTEEFHGTVMKSTDGNLLYFGSAGAGVFRRERHR